MGVAGGVPYVALVLIGMWLPSRNYILALAGLGTVLTIIGYAYSPAGGIPWVVLINRGLALFAVWVVTFVLLNRQRAEAEIRRLNAELEQRVEERTRELGLTNQALRQEVAERTRTEEALREREQYIQGIMDHAADAIITIDEAGLIESFNRAAENTFGYAAEEVIGKNVNLLMPEPEHSEHGAYLRNYQRTGEAKIIGVGPREVLGRRKDGSSVSLELAVGELRSGKRNAYIGALRDITERKQVQAALAASETRFRSLFENSTVGITFTDVEGRYHAVNAAYLDMLGYTEAELLGKRWQDFTHPDDIEIWDRDIRRMHAEQGDGLSFEKRFIGKDGGIVWARLHVVLIAGEGVEENLQAAIIRDITEQKLYEEALRHSEANLTEAQRIAHIGDWEFDEAESKLKWSAETYRIFGVAPETFQPSANNFYALVHPDDLDMVRRTITQGNKSGTMFDYEYRIVLDDGQIRWVHQVTEPYLGEGGIPRGRRGTCQDITESKNAEIALQASEARFRSIFENTTVGVSITDGDTNYVATNAAYQRMLGYDATELTNMSWCDITHPEDIPMGLRAVSLWRDGDHGERTFEKRFVHKDGHIVWARVSLTAIHEQGVAEPLQSAIVEDITERKMALQHLSTLENEVERRFRIDIMGELASSLAHELNQPLTATINYVAATKLILKSSGLAVPDTVAQCLDNAVDQARRAADVIKSLRRFVGKDDETRMPERLNEVIREISALASIGTLADSAQLQLDLAENLPPVTIDRVQVQQVIANLMRNAAESMKEVPQGILKITSRQSSEGELAVTVSDTGAGLSREMSERIFEPFHSAKPGGMGIGLTISKKIIESHGGKIWVTPNPGQGAIFHFTLPVEEESPREEEIRD